MLTFSSLERPKSWLQNAFREVPPLLPEPERPHFERSVTKKRRGDEEELVTEKEELDWAAESRSFVRARPPSRT